MTGKLRHTLDTLDTLGTPQPAPLHAIYLEVADRAQDVAWQAYLQDRCPSPSPAYVAPGIGVVEAYARLGAAVERLLDTLAEGGQFADRWRDTRRVTVNFCGARTLRIRAYREPNRHRRRLRIVLDSHEVRRPQPGQPAQPRQPVREQEQDEDQEQGETKRGETEAHDEQA